MRPRKFVRSTALVLVLTAALTVTAFAADPTQRPANETDNKSSYSVCWTGQRIGIHRRCAGGLSVRHTHQ